MRGHLWNILDVFEITGRGVVISGDSRECDECPDVPAGHVLQIRKPDNSTLEFDTLSIGFIDPPNRERPRHFMLSGDVKKTDVPIGSEVWYIEPSNRENRNRQITNG
jgi:hypothetical protein